MYMSAVSRLSLARLIGSVAVYVSNVVYAFSRVMFWKPRLSFSGTVNLIRIRKMPEDKAHGA